MKVLIFGITGMLGNAMFRLLSEDRDLRVFGTARRNSKLPSQTDGNNIGRILTDIDVENHDALVRAFSAVRPELVINCVGLVKQLADSKDPLQAVPLNTLLPHRLKALCAATGARLVHISTDCVFAGTKGNYVETDFPDANDLYGRSKLMGEVSDSHALTIRTSIIGHELSGHKGLIGWFLQQQGPVKGFTHAIFSGLPTVELARVIHDFILPRPSLSGLYHVASTPISKFDLLHLVAKVYGREIDIVPSDELVIDRSLNAERFRAATGYSAPDWRVLVERMHAFQ